MTCLIPDDIFVVVEIGFHLGAPKYRAPPICRTTSSFYREGLRMTRRDDNDDGLAFT